MDEQQHPAADGPPVTGDPAVDHALRDLHAAAGQRLAERVEAAAVTHRVLQERLRAPGVGDGEGDHPS